MREVLKKTIKVVTKKHDFENGWSYIENWINGSLKDSFFAETENIFVDGSLKTGAIKWFLPEKRCKIIDWSNFNDFESLIYVDRNGREVRVSYDQLDD